MGCGASSPPGPTPSNGCTSLFPHTAREDALQSSGSLEFVSENLGFVSETLEIVSDQEEEAVVVSEEDGAPTPSTSSKGGAVLLYPMYLMSWMVLMDLTHMMAHQAMRARGDLVEWSEDFLGRVILISHEWLGYTHPDPAREQLVALQGVLSQLASGKVSVQSTWQRQLFLRDNEKVPGKHLAAVLPTCYFWLDFAGVPQDVGADIYPRSPKEPRYRNGGAQRGMAAAIRSIPAYVERSTIILVLTPTAQHQDVPERICGFPSWRGRGWCRVELMASSLSRAHVRVMRCNGASATPEFLAGSEALFLPPGEGIFTCCTRGHVVNGRPISCDKPRIRKILAEMVEAGAEHLRRVGNLLNHRYLLCNKSRCLRGLQADAAAPLAARKPSPGGGASAEFRDLLHWSEVDDVRALAGQAPSLLHWAAIAGDAAVLRELMGAGWSGDAPMRVGFREFGWPQGLLPLHLAVASADGAPDAGLALLDAGASPLAAAVGPLKIQPFSWLVSLGTLPQLASWLDRLPGWDLEQPDKVYGMAAAAACAMTGAESAPRLRLLLGLGANARAGSHMLGADSALYAACWKEDSDPQAVRLLLDARCSPNMAVRPGGFVWKAIYGIARAAVRFKGCRGEQPGPLAAMLAEQSGSTPLHAAAWRGDVPVMRLLLQAQADPARRNDMGRTPLGLAALSFGGTAPGPVEAVLCEGFGAVAPERSAKKDIIQAAAAVISADEIPPGVPAGKRTVSL